MDIYWSLVVLHYGVYIAAHLSVMIESENESLASFLVNCPCERCDTLESRLTRDVPRRIALERWFGGLALDIHPITWLQTLPYPVYLTLHKEEHV